MSLIIQKAKKLATEKHEHLHLYNASRSPAINHIAEVAQWVEQNGGTEEMIAAAWLHDIVEDTDVTLEQVAEWFGPKIAELVDGLTDPPHFEAMPLEQRKKMQAERLHTKNDHIKIIKICDQLSNVLRVTNDPPIDWSDTIKLQYIRGARQVTEICRDISTELDELFDNAYMQACKKYEGIK